VRDQNMNPCVCTRGEHGH